MPCADGFCFIHTHSQRGSWLTGKRHLSYKETVGEYHHSITLQQQTVLTQYCIVIQYACMQWHTSLQSQNGDDTHTVLIISLQWQGYYRSGVCKTAAEITLCLSLHHTQRLTPIQKK